MLPKLLSMQAFGPYVEKQTLDFSKFPSLFLIRGETGSGKTMMLDAMTYALYGKSSGGQREDLESMRSRFAKDELPTELSFTFSIREHTYRFQRSIQVKTKRNNEKTTKQSIDAGELIDGHYVPFFENPKLKNIEEKAEELIGLTHAQFIQVMVLPQGKFEQLLTSKSEEKQDILRTLFQMERWVNISTYLNEKAMSARKDMEAQKQKLESLWQSVGASDLEELTVWIEQLQAQQVEVHQEVTSLIQRNKEIQQCLQEQQQLHKDHEAYLQLKAQEQRLLSKEQVIQQAQALVTEYQLYEKILPYYEQKKRTEKELVLRQEARAIASEQLHQAILEAKQVALWKQEIEELEQERSLLQQQLTDWNLYQTSYIKRVKDEQTLDHYRQEAKQKEVAWRKQEEHLAEVTRNQEKAMSDYLQTSAMQLRQQLEDGKPCPVCGALYHTTKQQVAQEYGTLVDLQTLQKEVTTAREEKDRLQLSYHELQARIKEYEELMEQEWKRVKTQHQQIDTSLTKVSLPAIKQQIQTIEQRITACTKQQKEKEANSIRVNSLLQQATQQDHAATKEEALARDKAIEANAIYQSWILDVNEEKLTQLPDATTIAKDINMIEDYEKQKLQLATQLVEVQKRLQDKETLDLGELRKQSSEAETLMQEKQQHLAHLISQKELYEGVQKQGQALRKAYEEKQPSYQKLVEFSRAIRGDNSIGIERYVLGVMLSHITQTANQLLRNVHQGRYQLFRSEHASNKTRKFGLEFSIYDSYTCAMRSVVSLSGGEKFLVSLALSLALSHSVQARNGGIQFDCMFIDEGFGTLDEHSIVDALSILEMMGKQKGKIGIISHVELLKENIPYGVEVNKTRSGSSIQIREE